VPRSAARRRAGLDRSHAIANFEFERSFREFVGDRLPGARLARAYAIAVPERRRVTGEERRDDDRLEQDGGSAGRMAAIYARASSERQRQRYLATVERRDRALFAHWQARAPS
jgi:hypothetical protein